MDAIDSITTSDKRAAARAAVDKLDALDRTVASWKSKTPANSPLYSIIAKYESALQAWRNGLAELDVPLPDIEKAKQG